MLSKKLRLDRGSFNRFFKEGARLHGTYSTLIYKPFPTFHGAVVVSKKVAKSAVLRNALRRKLYPILKQTAAIGAHCGVYIVILKQTAKDASVGDIAADLQTLLGRVHLPR